MKLIARFLAAGFLGGISLAAISSAPAADKPNIVFLLADDIGYGDLGCYGATLVKTPNLDRLARQGCRFSDAHSPAATCTPTRRALLTGTYSWRQQPGSSIAPGDAPLSIPPGTTTVASLLKQAGYRTGVVGKWHLGLGGEGGPDWNGDIKPGPLEIGFDYAFIMPATGDRVPCVYVENHRVAGLDPKDPIQVSYKQKVGLEPTGQENPELLKLKHTHGHDMTIVNGVGRIGWMTGGKSARWMDEEMADTFTKKAIGFLEQNKDRPFFLYLATHDIHVPRVPHPRFKGTSQCGTRGDAIHELDDAVGQVLAALDRLQLAGKTLFIFTSDNGGVWDDGYEDMGSKDHRMNGPLRGTKGTLFEGGHRVPFIARWPGRIKAGSESSALIVHLDMAATFAALTGVKVPAGACPDSLNVLPALLGEKTAQPVREHFVAHIGGIQGPFAVRQGGWKYIEAGRGGYGKAAGGAGPGGTGPQLYNLGEDLAETKNLAAEKPEKVKQMQTLLARLRESGGAPSPPAR
ncbi:MAG: arylsulfatase [Verrucomicrobiota bacterium]